jgi:hypothetical protein
MIDATRITIVSPISTRSSSPISVRFTSAPTKCLAEQRWRVRLWGGPRPPQIPPPDFRIGSNTTVVVVHLERLLESHSRCTPISHWRASLRIGYRPFSRVGSALAGAATHSCWSSRR